MITAKLNWVHGALVVAAIASFNLFYRLGEVSQPIWDESYYLTSTARYELRYASFASHPPLGLMLIAAGDRISGANATVDWSNIAARKTIAGERMPRTFSWWGVRCASALFGVVAAVLVFLLMTELAGTVAAGLFASSPFLFDTALIAQFRAAQLDSFQVCFAAAALLCLVKGDKRKGDHSGNLWWPLGFGVACGLSAMVRANGILLLAGILLPVLRALCATSNWPNRIKTILAHVAVAAAGCAAAIIAVFLVHVAVANRAMPSSWAAARADAPFVTISYDAYLAHKLPLSIGTMIVAADGYRQFIAADIAGVGLKDSNASPPWLWPLGIKPIVYGWNSDGHTTSTTALVPNPAAWAVSLAGVIGGIVAMFATRRRGTGRDDRPLILTLLALWATFMLCDVALAQLRVMYLYHYFLPLLFGWLLAAILLAHFRPRSNVMATAPNFAVGLIFACFVMLAPFALHRPLTDHACRLRTLIYAGGVCAHPAQTHANAPNGRL